MPIEAEQHTFANVACQRCGCLCDDLQVQVAEGRVRATANTCHIADPWFAELSCQTDQPAAVAGQGCSVDEALTAAVTILRESSAPLIYGLAGCSSSAARSALALADAIGATIDLAGRRCQQPAMLAMQQVGKSTCTLGEIRHRADLVIYWGVDPLQSHPRHWNRYAVEPSGGHVPRGRRDRRVVVVDQAESETSRRADLFIPIDGDAQFEAIRSLQAMLQGQPINRSAGLLEFDKLALLADWMRQCQVGVVFHGERLSDGPHGHRTVETLFRLVRRLNDYVRFHAIGMGAPGEAAVDGLLAASTGFPFAVDLRRGYPRYSPGEYTADALLTRSEVDACLLVGEQPLAHLSAEAVVRLESLPTIYISPEDPVGRIAPRVRISTSRVGVHTSGTTDRMDGVPIPLRPFLSSSRPSAQDVLDRLLQLLSE